MFELASPWVLVFLPLPVLVWFLVPRDKPVLPAALKVPFYQHLAGIVEARKTVSARSHNLFLMLFIWMMVLLALAGPRWVGEPVPVKREGYNIMLALDISGSMDLTDMMLHGRPASRLAVVKRAAIQFVRDRIGDQVGLILFASRAYLQTPLTYDRQNVLMRIADATVGLAGKTTSLGDALGLAVKRFQDAPKKGRIVILLTDGVHNSGVLPPVKAAQLAKSEDIKVYTIGLGTDTDPSALGGVFLNAAGDLDEETLKKIAHITGGRYFHARDLKSLQTIYETINSMEKVTQKQAVVRPYHEYYPWPLGGALLLLMAWLAQVGHWKALLPRRQLQETEQK